MELFRRCVATPRPSSSIVSPFPGIELRCQAIGSFEVGTSEEIILASVIDETGARAFSKKLLGKINPREFELLWHQVENVLLRDFPCLGLTDLAPWRRLLAEGARDPQNQVITHALGGCVDHSFGAVSTERPDRYFGVPLHQLIDAQWMAFWAAREVVSSKEPKPDAKPRRRKQR